MRIRKMAAVPARESSKPDSLLHSLMQRKYAAKTAHGVRDEYGKFSLLDVLIYAEIG